MNAHQRINAPKAKPGTLVALLTSGFLLAILSGCSHWANLWPDNAVQGKRTVGRAMVREKTSRELPMATYLRPGAGGIGPDGKLVVASSVKTRLKPKQQLDACGNPITPTFNSAELNDDQRTLSNLITQMERQLNSARRSAYTANNPALKDLARSMASENKLEIQRLRHLRKQLCKQASRAIAASEKAKRVH